MKQSPPNGGFKRIIINIALPNKTAQNVYKLSSSNLWTLKNHD